MKPVKLSICIASLHSRVQLLHELQCCLSTQERLDEVQISIAADAGQLSIGTKRNFLVKASIGEYIAHIDDDDLVHADYVKDLLEAIDRMPGVDCIAVRGRRTEKGRNEYSDVLFDYRLGGPEGEWIHDDFGPRCIWRSPGHVCAVRADHCKAVPFTDVRQSEDLIWNQAVAPRLQTLNRVKDPLKELYLYRWDPHREPYT